MSFVLSAGARSAGAIPADGRAAGTHARDHAAGDRGGPQRRRGHAQELLAADGDHSRVQPMRRHRTGVP